MIADVSDRPVSERVARFAWITLCYNVAVVVWGAYVRATGSGAGCGSHWPLCNGEVLPRAPRLETIIELSHRLTSGVALIAVVALAIATWRTCAAGHPARRAAACSLLFMLSEAAVGAGLVLFQLVADNASAARAMFMATHLVNTFLLLASLALTAYWLSGEPPVSLRGRGKLVAGLAAIAGGLLLVAISGSVAALGDTLFPSRSLAEAMAADMSASSHILLRLRIIHPMLAVLMAGALMLMAPRLPVPEEAEMGRELRYDVIGFVALQLAAGFANLILLAPVWMQLVHLLLADVVWIAFVLLAAAALAPGLPAEADAEADADAEDEAAEEAAAESR
jgi:cytochrome c oxidase assembly protein subunit 15